MNSGALYSRIREIYVPATVNKIAESAFSFFVRDIYYEGTEEEWNRIISPYKADPNELVSVIPFTNFAEVHFAGTTEPEPICGDVDCSGDVTLLDAVLLNKYLMIGEEIPDQGKLNADVDLNDKLDTNDSLSILKCCIELISLPVE